MMVARTLAFENCGGWVCDNGYLLAHGLGRPVDDASTHIVLPTQTGSVRLWAWTRDWVSPQGPGRFEIVLQMSSGEFRSPVLGVGRGDWHWADCGLVEVAGPIKVSLHDLSGFDARCGAIALTSPTCVPEALLEYPQDKRARELSFDVVVIGGGYAGMCAAVASARKGISVALVQDRPVFGGNASSEVRVGPIGRLGLGPFPLNSDLAYELMELTHVHGKKTSGGLRPLVDSTQFDSWLGSEKKLTLFRNTRLVDSKVVRSEDTTYAKRIGSVLCYNWRNDSLVSLTARQFVDATGDGALARYSGAEVCKLKDDEERLTGGYGNTNFWTTRWTMSETQFPSCPWAIQIDETNREVSRPKYFVEGDLPYAAGWNWESGFDKDPVRDAEFIRDLNFRAAYGMWDYLKNKAPDKARFAKAEMDWLGYVLGKRAATRIAGDYVLSERDLVEHREYADGVVTTSWFLDLHAPHPMNEAAFPGESFRSIAYDDPNYKELMPNADGRHIEIRPYAIPYRCFYSRNIENLWMSGKDISCTHVAMSSVRVENTTAQMGTMVGRAIALCVREGWSPRELGRHWECLVKQLRMGALSNLAKRGKRRYEHRTTIKGELKYWLRPIVRIAKKVVKLCQIR